jgi:hypothetical protein
VFWPHVICTVFGQRGWHAASVSQSAVIGRREAEADCGRQ